MEVLSRLIFGRRRRPGGFCARLLVVALVCCSATEPAIPAEVPREYDVKSVLLFNFTQFVEWPAAAFAGADAPFVIGIYGRDPFGLGLDKIVRDERVGGRRIVIERFRDITSAAHCQMLFIGASERGDLPLLMTALAHRPLLTVADFDGFLQRGGMVQFYKNAENKIRVRVNLVAARTAQLSISAKLLRVVEIIPPEEP